MYSVYLVDDEPWALKLMENGFPWERNGFAVVGRSKTLGEALRDIPRLLPDVVCTDIRIAGESGIDLIREIRDRGINATVIVLTGYADFHIAQAAIKLDVFDFLLKPLDLAEADALLQKLQRHEREKEHGKRQDALAALRPLTVEEFLRRRGLSFRSSAVRAVTVREVPPDVWQELPFPDCRTPLGARQALWILEQTPSLENELLRQLRPLQGRYPVGVSGPARRDEPVVTPINQADMISYQAFLTGQNEVFFYPGQQYRKVIQLADELLQDGGAPSSKTPEWLYGRWLRDSYHLENLAQLTTYLAQSTSVRGFARYTDLLEAFGNAKELADYVVSCLQTPSGARSSDEKSWLHDQTVKWLQERYTGEVSLAELARELNVSSSYLSEVFSKYEGVSFSRYLSRLRNTRACELLAGTALSIQEIAEMSGFHDAFYISRQFKKVYGMTPMQYREKKSRL